ncbi:Rhs-family protein [Minicystis rosea]|nr:Rhs-family protein [Minicystis rosea]
MARTAPAPNIPPIPGMCPSVAVLAGGGDAGNGSGDGAGDGNGDENAGAGSGGENAEADARGAPDYEKYPDCGYESHPVDVVTGRAFTHPITDLELPGPLPLSFSRMYSSKMAERDTGLGFGWGHTFGWEVEVKRRSIVVWNEQGIAVDFPLIRPGEEVIGPWGWVLRREVWGFAVDADDGLWHLFSVAEDEGKRYRLTALEDRNRNRISLTYDDGKLVEVKDSAGRIVRLVPTREGRIGSIQVQNAISQGQWIAFATYAYDDAGNLVGATDAEGHAAHYEYDEDHRLTADTDRTGLCFHFVYDREGRCVESWGDYPGRRDPSLADGLPRWLADGVTPIKGVHHCRFEYLKDGYTEVANSLEVRRYFGNRHGTLDKSVIGRGVVTCTYDDHGFLLSRTDEMKATTTYERDARGRLLKVVDPLGRITQITRDAAGQPIEIVDPAGGVTVAHRDSFGNVVALINAAGAVTSYVNDTRGLPTQVTLPNGGRLHVTCDAHGNPAELVQPDGGVWRWKHDHLGRLLEEIDPLGHATRFAYSQRGNMIARTDPAGGVTRYTYDGEEQITQVVEPTGARTSGTYGGYHRFCRREQPDGAVIHYRYDYEGRVVEIIDGRGEVRRFAYSTSGDLVSETAPDGRLRRFKHDAAGRVTEIVDGLREKTKLVYDAAGQIVERSYGDLAEAFEYDGNGDLVIARGGIATVEVMRDALGRITSETIIVGDDRTTVEVDYDTMGRRISRRTSRGHAETIERDVMGNPTRTRLGDSFEILHANDALGREIARHLPGGGRIESTFDAAGRLAKRASLTPVVHRPMGRDEPEWLGQRDGGIATERRYLHDGDRILEIHGRRRGPVRFEYEPDGAIAAARYDQGPSESFRWDAGGNVHPSGEDRVYGPGNRLLQKGNTQYVWDDAGRLVEKRKREHGVDEVWRYGWNAKDLLESVTSPDGTVTDFRYDAFRRRVQKRVSRSLRPGAPPASVDLTTFAWDGDLLVHEIRRRASAGGDPVVEERTYAFEDDSFAPLAHEDVRVEGGLREARGWLAYMTDDVGTPEALILPTGMVAHEVETTVWGRALPARSGEPSTPLRFAGQYADEETGLSYNRFRYYDPDTGTFLSPDPIGTLGGLNEYAFVPDPNTFLDPLGLAATTVMKQGDRLEKKRKADLRAQGYEILPSKVGAGNGMDIVAVKRDTAGTITEMRVEECKSSKKSPKGLATSAAGQQLSDPWMNDNRDKMKKKGGCVGKTAQDMDDFEAAGGKIEKFCVKGTQPKKGQHWKIKGPTPVP